MGDLAADLIDKLYANMKKEFPSNQHGFWERMPLHKVHRHHSRSQKDLYLSPGGRSSWCRPLPDALRCYQRAATQSPPSPDQTPPTDPPPPPDRPLPPLDRPLPPPDGFLLVDPPEVLHHHLMNDLLHIGQAQKKPGITGGGRQMVALPHH